MTNIGCKSLLLPRWCRLLYFQWWLLKLNFYTFYFVSKSLFDNDPLLLWFLNEAKSLLLLEFRLHFFLSFFSYCIRVLIILLCVLHFSTEKWLFSKTNNLKFVILMRWFHFFFLFCTLIYCFFCFFSIVDHFSLLQRDLWF